MSVPGSRIALIVAVAIASTAVLGASYVLTRANMSPEGSRLVAAANSWAAFTAEIRARDHGFETTERYYQASDGSSRREAFAPGGSEGVVTIHNFKHRMTYVRSPTGDWAMLPLTNVRTTPPTFSPGMKGLSPTPESRLGVTVYRYVDAGDQVHLIAPELNFFKLQTETPQGATREVIRLDRTEPRAELFMPPTGAKVRAANSINDVM